MSENDRPDRIDEAPLVVTVIKKMRKEIDVRPVKLKFANTPS